MAHLGHGGVHGTGHNGIAVVLAGYERAVLGKIRHRLVHTAVAVFQLFRFCARGKSHELVAQTDAENRPAQRRDLLQVFNDLHIFGRVARAVGEHHAVHLQRRKLGRGGASGHQRHLAAAFHKIAQDVAFIAEIEQRNMVLSVFVKCFHTFCSNAVHRVLHRIGFDLFHQSGVGAHGVRALIFGGERAVHHAALADDARQAAGVHARDADDPLLLQKFVQRFLAAEIGRRAAQLPHDVAKGPNARGFGILAVHAVVPHQRIGLCDDLAVIAGVGEGFLVADHARVEHDLAHTGTGCAEGPAFEHHAVRQQQICFHMRSPFFQALRAHSVCLACSFILRLPRCTSGSLPSLQMGHSSGA